MRRKITAAITALTLALGLMPFPAQAAGSLRMTGASAVLTTDEEQELIRGVAGKMGKTVDFDTLSEEDYADHQVVVQYKEGALRTGDTTLKKAGKTGRQEQILESSLGEDFTIEDSFLVEGGLETAADSTVASVAGST